jgi:hypothetical protein
MKFGCETNPFVKGAFLEPGQITTLWMLKESHKRTTVCARGIEGYFCISFFTTGHKSTKQAGFFILLKGV